MAIMNSKVVFSFKKVIGKVLTPSEPIHIEATILGSILSESLTANGSSE